MRELFAALAAMALLSGCAHAIVLSPRGGGAAGHGSAPMALGNSGRISVALNSQTYSGLWTYVPDGGSLTLLNGVATSQNGLVSVHGAAASTSTRGAGLANLSAADGSSMRCEFTYSEWSGTGVGVCQRNDGALYDIHIN